MLLFRITNAREQTGCAKIQMDTYYIIYTTYKLLVFFTSTGRGAKVITYTSNNETEKNVTPLFKYVWINNSAGRLRVCLSIVLYS